MAKKWSEYSKGYKMFYISAVTLAVIFFLISISASNDDAKNKEILDKEAVAAGFASYSEKVAAEDAGFKDKASYAKHLAEVEAKKKAAEIAAQERTRIETARATEAETSAAMEQAPMETSVGRDALGRTMDYWENACAQFEAYKRECSVADSQGSCLESKLGENPSLHLHICQDGYWNDPARYRY